MKRACGCPAGDPVCAAMCTPGNPQDRSIVRFSVRSSVEALESTAAPAIDTWTRLGPGQRTTVAPRANSSGYMAPGGAIQLIVPDSYSHLLVALA